ncbi:MAG: ATP-binding protein [Candidatus Woesearchaeota archaeon]
MYREALKQLLLEQNAVLQNEDYASRELLEQIKESDKTPFAIIISGVRRCGKSTLLKEIMSLHEGYFVNFDDDRLVSFTVNDFQQMYELLIELFGKKDIFFFDEIQNISGWERFVRRLNDQGKKVYITGSNANMLSKELGTHLTGRNISFTLYPLSFKEFLGFLKHDYKIDKLTTEQKSILKRLFNEYEAKGGFPEYLKTYKEEYIKSLYENIIYRDIITRYSLPDEKALKEIVYYAASNIGKELSFNSLRKLTGLTSATTVKEYFGYLENSYLAFLLPRYNPSLTKQIYSNKKVYFVDTAVVRLLGFRANEDAGRLLENLVFLHLKRHGKETYFHKEKNECDFVLREGTRVVEAIQVTLSLGKNKDRELMGLVEAMHIYKLKEGTILTLDEEYDIPLDKRKISVKPVWKWLLEPGRLLPSK